MASSSRIGEVRDFPFFAPQLSSVIESFALWVTAN